MPYKDPEKRKENARQYMRKWRLINRQKSLEIGRKSAAKWRENHTQENRDNARQQRINHPSALKEWFDNHPGYKDEWNAKNIERVKQYSRDRYALDKAADGTYTVSDIALILDAQDNRCYYCDEVLDQTYHVDHKQPVSRGGSNWPENLACTCQSCNLSKGAQTESEFVLRQFAGSPCST
jgi:5-methylcytosine-specific restriction endonuclease McrA